MNKTLFGDVVANLAPELLVNIFGFLPFDDLKNATMVCRFVV